MQKPVERIANSLHRPMDTERPDDDFNVVAEIRIALRRNGAMSVWHAVGGDKALALGMLAEATESLKRQIPDSEIIIPARDVALERVT